MDRPPKKLAPAILIGLLLGVLCASCWLLLRRHVCSSHTTALLPQKHLFYTTRHLVASGQEAVASFLESHKDPHGNPMGKALERHYTACVRMQNRHNFTEKGAYNSASGCGVIVGDGKFALTAGHLFNLSGVADSKVKIVLTTGELLDAELCHVEFDKTQCTDLAILRIHSGALPVSAVEMAEARPGQMVFTIGYPQSFGLGQDGALQEDLIMNDKADYLEPLVQVGRIQSVSNRIVVVPMIGCSALLGLSGAPVLDEDGRLVGIFVDRHRRKQRNQRAEYTMHVVPVMTGSEESVLSLIGRPHQ